jgi:hypothetical protein
MAMRMFSENPCPTKDEFLQRIDRLIASLQLHETEFERSNAHLGKASAIEVGATLHQ